MTLPTPFPPLPTEATRAAANSHNRRVKVIYNDNLKAINEELVTELCGYLSQQKIPMDICNSETGELVIPAGRRITKAWIRNLAKIHDKYEIDPSPLRIKLQTIIRPFTDRIEKLKTEVGSHTIAYIAKTK